VYDILGQDNAGTWIAKTFPDLLYIRATYGVFGWPADDAWLHENVQSHGPLGAVYPNRAYSTEGDSPSFFHVYPTGINDPDKVDHGGWGGRFDPIKKTGIRGMDCMKGEDEVYDPYYMYGDAPEGQIMVIRWSEGINNDFQARMDWSMTSNYSDANHHPAAFVNGDNTKDLLYLTVSAGSIVNLSAAGSSDPDGDSLHYSWEYYSEPSSYERNVTIENHNSPSVSVSVPPDAGGRNIHILLTVHDNGAPNLFAYRHLIINVN
jgi:hypothetical protein